MTIMVTCLKVTKMKKYDPILGLDLGDDEESVFDYETLFGNGRQSLYDEDSSHLIHKGVRKY